MKKYFFAIFMLLATNSFAETLTMGSDYLVPGDNSEGGQILSGGYYYSPCFEDTVNNFAPLPLLSRKSINSVKCLVTSKTEKSPYDGEWLLSFEIRNYKGEIKHLVSQKPIDMDKVNYLQVLAPALSRKSGDRVIEIGEYLALHVYTIGPEPPQDVCYNTLDTVNLYCEADVR